MPRLHYPVLLESVLEEAFVEKPVPQIVVDATLGLGGHSYKIISRLHPGSIWVGIDRDSENLIKAKEFLFPLIEKQKIQSHFVHGSFSEIQNICQNLSIKEVDFILYDLGVSSVHLDEGERGFSFRFDAPLDMRFDRTTGETAAQIVNTYELYDLRKMFTEYGEEPKAHYIASAIIEARKKKPIETTKDLVDIIEASSFDKKSTLRVFQALRITLNDEFSHITTSLEQAVSLLSLHGRIGVITFHSLEDRLVKQFFLPYLKPVIDEITGQDKIPARLSKVTKKPIEPTEQEIAINPRSRSAKLRIVEKLY